MKNLEMFCISLEPNHYKFIKSLGYTPVRLGDKNFNDNWFGDKFGMNISEKNKELEKICFLGKTNFPLPPKMLRKKIAEQVSNIQLIVHNFLI